MQLEHVRIAPSIPPGKSSARWIRSAATPAMPISCLVRIDLRKCHVVPAALPTASANDRFSRCICRQTSSAIRTSAECENAPKSTSDSSGPE